MADIYGKKQRIKLYFLVVATLIIIVSVYFSNQLIAKLAEQEVKRVELLAEAYRMVNEEDNSLNLSLVANLISNNTTIPIILTDSAKNVVLHRNIKLPKKNESEYLASLVHQYGSDKEPITIKIDESSYQYLYYDQSILLKQLKRYPYFQFSVIILFVIIGFIAFSNFKKAEENQVWIGLSKETAHQLGTPISSLMAWVELLKTSDSQSPYLDEISKDINRLMMVADRFSKIGSKPTLEIHNLIDILDESVGYIMKRASKKVILIQNYNDIGFIPVNINRALFEWVIENICKNAFDAMEGKGELSIVVNEQNKFAIIDITDSGKGIPKAKQKTVFEPGYTTKQRGWGLGLSLAKRIVVNYHDGKIFVKNSEINKGTTFRIMVPIRDNID